MVYRGEDKMSELIKKFYLLENLNCAQTILAAANLEYHLNLDEKFISSLAGFGGGLQEEDLCGVVSGSVVVLSVIFNNPDTKNSLLKQAVIKYKTSFSKELKDINCRVIKPEFRDETEGCYKVITTGYKFLKLTIEEFKKKMAN
jgi:C_GCAxxG_C_C family probable redox protein